MFVHLDTSERQSCVHDTTKIKPDVNTTNRMWTGVIPKIHVGYATSIIVLTSVDQREKDVYVVI